jgi:hypothetical protein
MSKVQIIRMNKRKLEMIKIRRERNVQFAIQRCFTIQRCNRIIRTRNWTSALDQGGLLHLVGIVEGKNRALNWPLMRGLTANRTSMRQVQDKSQMIIPQRGSWDIRS